MIKKNSGCKTKKIPCMRTAIMLCMVMLAGVLSACGSKKELTAREAGVPYSDWEKSMTGSAKYLDGDTVLVSIFLEDRDAFWTSADRALVADNMDIAVDYLKSEGERYGKRVNLIYDLEEHPDLEYHMKYKKPFPGTSQVNNDNDREDELIYAIYDYLENEIPVQDIMEKYQVNSIGFLVFIDSEAKEAVAYHYLPEYEGWYYTEMCCINLRWKSTGDNVKAETYAHEILHLFGARDLYCSNMFGISKEFVDYAAEEYANDIMLGHARKGVSWKHSISADITDITAYSLGWKYSIPEIKQFPDIAMTYSAVASAVTPNYVPYELPGRRISEKRFMQKTALVVFQLIIYVTILIRVIIQWRKEKKSGVQTERDAEDWQGRF